MPTKKTSKAAGKNPDEPSETKPKRKAAPRKRKVESAAKATAAAKAEQETAPEQDNWPMPISYNIPETPSAPQPDEHTESGHADGSEEHHDEPGSSPEPAAAPAAPSAPASTPPALSGIMQPPPKSSGSMGGMPSVSSTPTPGSSPRFNDIKPKQNAPDTSFLAPEQFSFDLKQQRQDANAKRAHTVSWIKPFIYILSAVVIVIAVAMLALTYFAQKNSGQLSLNGNPFIGGSKYKIAIVNAPLDKYDSLSQAIKNKFGSEITVDSMPTTLSATQNDMLYFKSSAKAESTKLVDFLNSQGINPQLQQDDNLHVDFALYVSNNPNKNQATSQQAASPQSQQGSQSGKPAAAPATDLHTFTAAVYNATSTSGLAKQFCGYLKTEKVKSCAAANATSTVSGLQVSYKDPQIKDILSQMSQFAGATFTPAEPNQTTDIKVVIGK